MKETTYDINDVGRLTPIDEETAREFIDGKVEVIIRVRSRDFQSAESLVDLEQAKRLREMGVYDALQFYLD